MQLEELVIKFKEKDVKAFEKLHQMYNKSVEGVIFNIVRDREIAEEVTQDVFIKAWNNVDSYSQKKGRFFTWIINIARNAAIDKTRSKNFKNSSKNLDAQIFVDILETYDSLDSRTDTIGIKNFVNKLKDTCVKVIELLYFKGFTQKEVSESLDMPLGTVKTRNRNCINELRIMLK
ncbi:sigma-70 family RNA polymerase sigma factor [Tenacibaculum sp. HL-MS23]|uniref:RNA polymerase sigma factor n=1 Tax=unclassified Tenacibaculum TaxID=2635139 RepID=UPI001C4F1AD6|nr:MULTISPECIES: sigma-70 family RNA polymerase sigma factor [unclassified Tenacibaculum]QXP74600.1 sigma-70 family RNA polymerase sigma factor [Tenacibaculum sp. AHE14PA]QXP76111.1 sigma-70 family RNA polymerase sigma factor [Tenacibaculum sp. AHE15PA]WNW02688.1 sigma-70 family RNA polymerase sigma factor [Tenacibaculum sp. HL-MS23]